MLWHSVGFTAPLHSDTARMHVNVVHRFGGAAHVVPTLHGCVPHVGLAAENAMGVCWHDVVHESLVHVLLSLHRLNRSVSDLRVSTQPVPIWHTDCMHTLGGVHVVLLSTHAFCALLHVYVEHSLLVGHTATLGTSAQ